MSADLTKGPLGILAVLLFLTFCLLLLPLWESVIVLCFVVRYFMSFGHFSSFVVLDFLFIVTPIVGVCNCSMFCCTLPYVHCNIAIILMGKRTLVALLKLVFLVSRDG